MMLLLATRVLRVHKDAVPVAMVLVGKMVMETIAKAVADTVACYQ